jgi:hypothetical protein
MPIIDSENRTNEPVSGMKPSPSLRLPPEIESSGWNFDNETRLVYRKIINDPQARKAFKKLTTGSKPIPPANLLLALGGLKSFPNRTWKDWDRWQETWEYLDRAVKSLRRIASKMQKYLGPRYRGPIPLPTWTGPEDDSYSKSHLAKQNLRSIAEQLSKDASEIEQYCKMRSEWLRKTPRKDRRGMAEKEHLVMFLRYVESTTGRPHTEHIAALVNVVRGKAGDTSEVSANELRKLSKRFSAAPRIAHWFPR